MPLNETRILLSLNDQELEQLVKKWISSRIADTRVYVGFDRPSASADMGRDAVGFVTSARYDGVWDNYQCKQLNAPLGIGGFTSELGKIFHYACKGHFTVPRQYIFVAPKGIVTRVQELVGKPSTIGEFLKDNWGTYCEGKISRKDQTPLTVEIRKAIDGFDFTKVEAWNVDQLVEVSGFRAVMHEYMDIDPGPAPVASLDDVPVDVGSDERTYVGQLTTVYDQHRGVAFCDYGELASDAVYGPQMINSRRRFLEHRAFSLHFRENMPEGTVDRVNVDVRDHIIDIHNSTVGYQRLTEVMKHAGTADVSGPLGKHKRVTTAVKQGACHHFANEGDLPWA